MAELKPAAGFTLVELLVVIAIVAVLIAIAVPTVSGLRSRALSAKCLSNLRHLGVALNAYLVDHDQAMPTLVAGRREQAPDEETIDVALGGYAGDPATFRCPADPGEWRRSGTSYYWNPALNGQHANALNFLGLTEAATRIPVLSDKEGWHAGAKGPKVNILFADGHAGKDLQLTTGD